MEMIQHPQIKIIKDHDASFFLILLKLVSWQIYTSSTFALFMLKPSLTQVGLVQVQALLRHSIYDTFHSSNKLWPIPRKPTQQTKKCQGFWVPLSCWVPNHACDYFPWTFPWIFSLECANHLRCRHGICFINHQCTDIFRVYCTWHCLTKKAEKTKKMFIAMYHMSNCCTIRNIHLGHFDSTSEIANLPSFSLEFTPTPCLVEVNGSSVNELCTTARRCDHNGGAQSHQLFLWIEWRPSID